MLTAPRRGLRWLAFPLFLGNWGGRGGGGAQRSRGTLQDCDEELWNSLGRYVMLLGAAVGRSAAAVANATAPLLSFSPRFTINCSIEFQFN